MAEADFAVFSLKNQAAWAHNYKNLKLQEFQNFRNTGFEVAYPRSIALYRRISIWS